MRKVISALIVSLFTGTSLFVQDIVRRPMTVDDAMNMVRVQNVRMSPDGNWVFFSKSELDWDQNRRRQRHYLIAAGGGEATDFIGNAGGSGFQFSPDGEHLSFLRRVDGDQQIFWMSMSGGEAQQLTDHENGIASYRWTADASEIFFTADEARSDEEQEEYDKGDQTPRLVPPSISVTRC